MAVFRTIFLTTYLLYLKGAYYYHFWAKCKLLYIYVPCTLRCAFLFNMPFSETIQTSIKCKRVFKKAYTKVVSESALFVTPLECQQ